LAGLLLAGALGVLEAAWLGAAPPVEGEGVAAGDASLVGLLLPALDDPPELQVLVPAAAFELERVAAHDLRHLAAALRASVGRWIGDLLQPLYYAATRLADEFVDGHELILAQVEQTL